MPKGSTIPRFEGEPTAAVLLVADGRTVRELRRWWLKRTRMARIAAAELFGDTAWRTRHAIGPAGPDREWERMQLLLMYPNGERRVVREWVKRTTAVSLGPLFTGELD